MKVKKILKKEMGKHRDILINMSTYHTYYHTKIDEDIVYIESKNGKNFLSNLVSITEEISNIYKDFKIFVYANKKTEEKIKKLQKTHNLKIHKIIRKESEALRTLEKAKYIITDSYVHKKYVKRSEQILIYFWDEIPLRTLGIDNIKTQHKIAHIQQTILSADYIIFPNEYCKEKVLNAYMMEKIYSGKILIEGYPRNNQIEDKRKDEIETTLNIKDKNVITYVSVKKMKEERHEYIENTLNELERNLTENEVVLVSLHNYNQSKIKFNNFKHIKPFPEEYDTYEVLNCASTLITDYSKLIFDFASRGKIILYNYSQKPFKNNETYINLDEIPFPQVNKVEDLINEINSPKKYDDSEFIEKYGQCLKSDSSKSICKHVFKGEKVCKEEKIENDKENVLIYGGELFNNGITSSLINLLNNINTEKFNIFITFRQWSNHIAQNHEHIFKMMPSGVEFLPLRSKFNPTIREKKSFEKFVISKNGNKCPDIVNRMLKREFEKQYPKNPFEYIINFDGYGRYENLLFSIGDKKNSIWVHSDMVREIESKGNQNLNVLKEAYNRCENVVLVSPTLIEPTSQISGRTDNLKIVHNINTYKKIQENSKKDIYINHNTEIITNHPEGIIGVLNRPGKKIITIGRYSAEKGHERLLNAFEKICDKYPDTQLIIIGGYGKLFDETKKLRNELKHWENVTLIKWISNPMPILKQCDLFILPSIYEGWGMVLMEADSLNIPVIATDCDGIQWMKDYDGKIIENSEEGILNGLYDFMEGDVNHLDIDFEEYNKNAIEEFYSIFE
ncbi:glycosyltransferase [Methanobrevibacter ruminantium]|uniref:glycosyltransferase n=1 Tax=Methanobrevibacter ruminantium TaxID=83816 RepID=UPI0026EE1206|nr:glycosyltransferase [Methanobrevibacter ruminantium]